MLPTGSALPGSRGERLPDPPPPRRPLLAADPTRVSAARLYDYFLDGKDNFAVDREAARALEQVCPEIRETARANRAFVARAVTAMAAEFGIRQFIDLGTGIPTSPCIHEIASQVAPDVRVTYVDVDPVVLAHTRALLSDGEATTSLQHDLRDPEALLTDERLRRHLDLSRPVGLLLTAVLHFVPADEAPGVLAGYRDAVAPGSCLALSAACSDGSDPVVLRTAEAMFTSSDVETCVRTASQIEALFDGFELVGPLGDVTQWRNPGAAPHRIRVLGGVGVRR